MSTPAPAPTTRLRTSPVFVQTATLDGRPYIAKETEPYTQYWLTERYRLLLALFGSRRGATVDEAMTGYLRLRGTPDTPKERQALARAITDMQGAGVLVRPDEDTSRYDARIVADYVAHRPFPDELARLIVEGGGITATTPVLDVAGGPGDLALALAEHSQQVNLMELSRGFLAAASRRARQRGLKLQPLHDSANRLVQRDERYGVITVSQALHWLDDVMVCRGVCRLLQDDGSFFVIHSAIELDDRHPLAYLLGHDSILGAKPRQSFVAEVQPLLRRLALLFEALDAPEVQRIDPTHGRQAGQPRIAPVAVSLFRQRRPFGAGYARGFLTPQHIAVTGQEPAAFWAQLEARCEGASPQQLAGTHHWAVLQFSRRAASQPLPPLDALAAREIGYRAATAAV